MSTTHTELALQRMLDEREMNTKLHEELVRAIEDSDDKRPTSAQEEQIKMYRETAKELDERIAEFAESVERDRKAIENSSRIRRALVGSTEGVDHDGDGIVYRSMASYARDFILTRESPTCSKIASQFARPQEVEAAKARLQLMKRVSNHTLSEDVPGLQPDQHIAEIFQVIDASRPLVASARRAALNRGTLTYPQVDQGPIVAAQGSEKTEGGDQELQVSMQTANATTYIGGGNLSWQAINWSTPDALNLWFQMAAAHYALLTEQDAGEVLQTSAFSFNVDSALDSTPSYEEYIAAIADGASEVYAGSGRMADTLYFAPDEFYKFAALVPTATQAAFLDGGLSLTGQRGSFAGLRIVVSRGLDAGVAIVGDSQGLLVAETAGAPVELRVVEPAIGGVEVGIIGAFEAVVVDAGSFSLLTQAS